jgi:hypothetical protein
LVNILIQAKGLAGRPARRFEPRADGNRKLSFGRRFVADRFRVGIAAGRPQITSWMGLSPGVLEALEETSTNGSAK